ncbi:hypothetical protein I3843_10G016900 [Carya illinoinensis]|nr:hypothetical protein I3843_10G016900 [Carya illinoinensis]
MAITDSVYFPVVFFEGHSQTNVGEVDFHPSLEFEKFRSVISCKLEIPPRQLSFYILVKHRSRKSKTLQRIPITRRSDFAAFSRHLIEFGEYFQTIASCMIGIPPRMLTVYLAVKYRSKALLKISITGNWYEKQAARKLQMERQRYLVDMGLSGLCLGDEEINGNVDEDGRVGGKDVVECEECIRAKELGSEAEFHCCMYDAVIFEFKSKAGPVSQPVKCTK